VIGARSRRVRPANVLLAAEIIGLAVTIELALRLMRLARLLDLIERLDGSRASRPGAVDEARLTRVVAAVYGPLRLERPCLRQSLVLLALLRRRGRPARLQIGVRKAGGQVFAHAWVESVESASDGTGAFFTLVPIRAVARKP